MRRTLKVGFLAGLVLLGAVYLVSAHITGHGWIKDYSLRPDGPEQLLLMIHNDLGFPVHKVTINFTKPVVVKSAVAICHIPTQIKSIAGGPVQWMIRFKAPLESSCHLWVNVKIPGATPEDLQSYIKNPGMLIKFIWGFQFSADQVDP